MEYLFYAAIFLVAMFVVAYLVPSLIVVSFKKKLFDLPTEERKIHKKIIPNLGGVAVFLGFLFTVSLFIRSGSMPQAPIVLASSILLFLVGIKDDLVGVSPLKKLMAQIVASLIIIVLADIRIRSLYGLFGETDIVYPLSVSLTVFIMVGIINAFNLVDGIDGLAGGLGLTVMLLFAGLFHLLGESGWAYMAIAFAGSLLGFLIYNVSPAKIFMGDTGSLIVGLLSTVMGIHFLEICLEKTELASKYGFYSAPALVMAAFIVPIFDTTRVFTLRILKNSSPFTADRNHLHHRLLDVKLTHTQASAVLILFTIVFTTIVYFLQSIGTVQLFLTLLICAMLFNMLLSLFLKQQKRYDEALKRRSVLETIEEDEFLEEILLNTQNKNNIHFISENEKKEEVNYDIDKISKN